MTSNQSIRFPSLTHPPRAHESFICFVLTPEDYEEVRVRYRPTTLTKAAQFRCDEHGDGRTYLCRHARVAATYMNGSTHA